MKLSRVIAIDKSDVHAIGQGQMSKVKVTEVKTNFWPNFRFRTVTPVWSDQWLRNDTKSLKQHWRGALLFFKVISQIERSNWAKEHWFSTQSESFQTVTWVEITDGYKTMHKAGGSIEEISYCFWKVICQISRSQRTEKLTRFGRFRTVTLAWKQVVTKWFTKLEAAQERCPLVFQGHLSIFKVTQDKKSPILTLFEHFRTVTLVWVHRWLWNDAQSLKQPRAGVLLFSKDICQILKLCGLEIADLDPILGRSQLSNPSGLPFYVSFTGFFQHGQDSVHSLLW